MARWYFRSYASLGLSLLVLLMTGCATQVEPTVVVAAPPTGPVEPVCTPQTTTSMIGQWYVVRKITGVVGEIQTLISLSADGKLKQQTRVKQGRNIRSELRETGCWEFAQSILRTRVIRSNGELVDFEDPIYQVNYQVDTVDQMKLVFREQRSNSKPMTARKMPSGFQLN
jgi:hypothetical protein